MNLAFITACYYYTTDPIRWLLESAKHYGIEVRPIGVKEPWISFASAKIARFIPELEKLKTEGFTHVLYADGTDSLFTNNVATIMWRYGSYNAPCVISGEVNCFPVPELAPQYPTQHKYRFINSGGYIGEIDWLIDKWKMLAADYPYDDDQEAISRAYLEGRMTGLEIDMDRRIFWANGHDLSDWPSRNGYRINPCVIHWNGGYAPEKAKMMEEEWRKFTASA